MRADPSCWGLLVKNAVRMVRKGQAVLEKSQNQAQYTTGNEILLSFYPNSSFEAVHNRLRNDFDHTLD